MNKRLDEVWKEEKPTVCEICGDEATAIVSDAFQNDGTNVVLFSPQTKNFHFVCEKHKGESFKVIKVADGNL